MFCTRFFECALRLMWRCDPLFHIPTSRHEMATATFATACFRCCSRQVVGVPALLAKPSHADFIWVRHYFFLRVCECHCHLFVLKSVHALEGQKEKPEDCFLRLLAEELAAGLWGRTSTSTHTCTSHARTRTPRQRRSPRPVPQMTARIQVMEVLSPRLLLSLLKWRRKVRMAVGRVWFFTLCQPTAACDRLAGIREGANRKK